MFFEIFSNILYHISQTNDSLDFFHFIFCSELYLTTLNWRFIYITKIICLSVCPPLVSPEPLDLWSKKFACVIESSYERFLRKKNLGKSKKKISKKFSRIFFSNFFSKFFFGCRFFFSTQFFFFNSNFLESIFSRFSFLLFCAGRGASAASGGGCRRAKRAARRRPRTSPRRRRQCELSLKDKIPKISPIISPKANKAWSYRYRSYKQKWNWKDHSVCRLEYIIHKMQYWITKKTIKLLCDTNTHWALSKIDSFSCQMHKKRYILFSFNCAAADLSSGKPTCYVLQLHEL